MGFKQWLNEAKIALPDPTGLGLDIRIGIEIVPGEDGMGAYVGRIGFSTPNRIGGGEYYTKFQHSGEAAQTALRQRLQQPFKIYVTKSLTIPGSKSNDLVPIEVKGLPSMQAQSLKPELVYGGSWQPGSLEQMASYDPEKHRRSEEFFGKIQQTVQTAGEKWRQEQKTTPKFGDGPPKSGQYITKNDMDILPDMVRMFGDFEVMVKWGRRPRQRIKASDLAKHYKSMVADAEIKTDDYIREIWVV